MTAYIVTQSGSCNEPANFSVAHHLPYPMFSITLNEAVLLTWALEYIGPGKSSTLVNALIVLPDQRGVNKLLAKIRRSIISYSNLRSYFMGAHGKFVPISEIYLVRTLWIQKLLKHNGYA